VETLQRIAWFCSSQGEHALPEADVDENFRQRPTYREGCLTDEPDLSIYDPPPAEESTDGDETDDEAEPPESEDCDG
jgi:hypothetical protein